MTTAVSSMQSVYQDEYKRKLMTAQDAVKPLQSRTNIAFGMGAGQPPALLEAIAQRLRSASLEQLKIYYKIAMEHAAKTVLAPDVWHAIEAHPLFMTEVDRAIIKKQMETARKCSVLYRAIFIKFRDCSLNLFQLIVL
jgi:itaconate CoA-transferase